MSVAATRGVSASGRTRATPRAREGRGVSAPRRSRSAAAAGVAGAWELLAATEGHARSALLARSSGPWPAPAARAARRPRRSGGGSRCSPRARCSSRAGCSAGRRSRCSPRPPARRGRRARARPRPPLRREPAPRGARGRSRAGRRARRRTLRARRDVRRGRGRPRARGPRAGPCRPRARAGVPADGRARAAAPPRGGPAWDTLVAAILLQRDAGGDLAGLLRDLAASLEAAARVDADARAATAQARFTARLVLWLPAGAAVLAELARPGSRRRCSPSRCRPRSWPPRPASRSSRCSRSGGSRDPRSCARRPRGRSRHHGLVDLLALRQRPPPRPAVHTAGTLARGWPARPARARRRAARARLARLPPRRGGPGRPGRRRDGRQDRRRGGRTGARAPRSRPTRPGGSAPSLVLAVPVAASSPRTCGCAAAPARRAGAMESSWPTCSTCCASPRGRARAPPRARGGRTAASGAACRRAAPRRRPRARSASPRPPVLGELERRCPARGIPPLTAALRRADRHGAPLAPTLAAQAADGPRPPGSGRDGGGRRAAPQIQLVVALLLVPAVMLLVAAALLPRRAVLEP